MYWFLMNAIQYISANSYLNIVDLVNLLHEKYYYCISQMIKILKTSCENFYICISLQLLGWMVDKYSSDESYKFFSLLSQNKTNIRFYKSGLYFFLYSLATKRVTILNNSEYLY